MAALLQASQQLPRQKRCVGQIKRYGYVHHVLLPITLNDHAKFLIANYTKFIFHREKGSNLSSNHHEMNELDNYKFPNNYNNLQEIDECPSPGTSPKQPTQQIPLRSAMSTSDRAFLRATGQQPSTSTTKTIPACFNSMNMCEVIDNRRKSVDVGGLARSNKDAKDGLGELIGDLFKKSKHLNEEEENEQKKIDEHTSEDTIDIPNKTYLIHKLSTWGFQPLTLNNEDLFYCAVIILEASLQLPSLNHLKLSLFTPFLIAVRKSYSAPNAYHNYTHAIDVLQATYSFLVMLKVAPPIDSLINQERWTRSENGLASKLLSDWDILSLLISAIGHDVGHPGLNNTFMVSGG